MARSNDGTPGAGAVAFVLIDTLDAWASTHLSAREAGLLYALHPQLLPPRLAAAQRHAPRAAAASWPAEPRFAVTLEVFARMCERLDDFMATLDADQRDAFTAVLLDEHRARSLLGHLLATC